MNLPDIVQSDSSPVPGALHRVGMRGVQLIAQVPFAQGQQLQPVTCDLLVDLPDAHQKGIHMSRLYAAAESQLQTGALTLNLLQQLADDCITGQLGSSTEAEVAVHATVTLPQTAAVSGKPGWRHYAVTWRVTQSPAGIVREIDLTLTYSSTCPCSAALSRDLAADQFLAAHGDAPLSPDAVAQWLRSSAGLPATPHSQRSYADVSLTLAPTAQDMVPERIAALEACLGTAVQAAVKREDEQAFAAANGANLLFSEDAARRLAAGVRDMPDVQSFTLQVHHEESLHPHDAVAVAVG